MEIGPNMALKPQQRSTIPVTLGSPINGMNTRDPPGQMDISYASTMINCIGSPAGVQLRTGWSNWVTGTFAPITSFIPYNGQGGAASKLFAVAGGNFYDVTSSGTLGAAVRSGLSTTAVYWQSSSMTYGTGHTNYTIAVNGINPPQMFDGTNWTACSQSDTPDAPGKFTTNDNNSLPYNINNFVDVITHQERLWFVYANSTLAYYTPIATAGSTAAEPTAFFDFGPLFARGSTLQKLATWTSDSGGSSGINPMLVAFSNKGDVVVFQGNNPDVAATWTYQATYNLGSPIGRRCTQQLGGDLLYLSMDGLFPLSKYIQSGRVDTTSEVTYKIGPTISQIVSEYALTPGFEMVVYPAGNIMLLNIPLSPSLGGNFQFCFHLVQGSWSQWQGINAQCFCLFNDKVYFGGTNYVGVLSTAYADNTDSSGNGGTNISAVIQQAYTFFNEQQGLGIGILKHVKMVRPFISTGSNDPNIFVGISTDFNLTPISGTSTLSQGPVASWDSSLWGSPTALWAGGLEVNTEWITCPSYPGDAIAVNLAFSAQTQTIWYATSFIVEPGGQIG
jgi:hypothetical protein